MRKTQFDAVPGTAILKVEGSVFKYWLHCHLDCTQRKNIPNNNTNK